MMFLVFLICIVIVIWFAFFREDISFRFFTKPYFMSLELDDPDVVLDIEPLLDRFRLKMNDKVLIRDDVIRLELRYAAHPIAHHLFLKRVYAMSAVGKIIVV